MRCRTYRVSRQCNITQQLKHPKKTGNTGPVLGFRRGVQSVQQCERLAGPVLGQQNPGQHQMPGLAGVVRLVVWAEAVVPRESGRGGEVTLGQQQPGSPGRYRVEQARRACCGLPSLGDRL
jgi:hypothetical protein